MKEYKIVGIHENKNGKYSVLFCIGESSRTDSGFCTTKVFVPTSDLALYKTGYFITVRCRMYNNKWYEFSTKKCTEKPVTEHFEKVVNLNELPF